MREVGGDFQDKFAIVFIVAQPFDKGLHHPHDGVAMRFDVGLGAGEATAGVVKTELAHIDERIEAEPFGGDILRRNERRAADHAFAQGGQTRRRAADRDDGEVAVGNKAAVAEYEADDAIFLGADRRDAEFFAFEIGDRFYIRRREKRANKAC